MTTRQDGGLLSRSAGSPARFWTWPPSCGVRGTINGCASNPPEGWTRSRCACYATQRQGRVGAGPGQSSQPRWAGISDHLAVRAGVDDREARLAENCGTDVSEDTIALITGGIVADLEAWQNPFDPVHAAVLIDPIAVKARATQLANACLPVDRPQPGRRTRRFGPEHVPTRRRRRQAADGQAHRAPAERCQRSQEPIGAGSV